MTIRTRRMCPRVPASRAPAGRPPAACATRPAPDAGFTVVEVLVALVAISVVMAALISFFVTTVRVASLSSRQQSAVELASEGIEAIRATPVADLQAAATSPNGRWIPPGFPSTVDPEQPIRNGVRFVRTWSVTTCWRAVAGGACGAQATGYLPFLNAAVTVTWREDMCPQAQCVFTTSTLVSNARREPVFPS